MKSYAKRLGLYTSTLVVGILLVGCGETPEEKINRELVEAARAEEERTWVGHRNCRELIKRMTSNPSRAVVPELYNALEMGRVPLKSGHLAQFIWKGVNMVQTQNEYGLTVGIEAFCEYDINEGKVTGFSMDGHAFLRNGVTL